MVEIDHNKFKRLIKYLDKIYKNKLITKYQIEIAKKEIEDIISTRLKIKPYEHFMIFTEKNRYKILLNTSKCSLVENKK